MKSALEKDGIVCIYGSGGLGKSELAKQYIHISNYAIKIWLHSEFKFWIPQIQAYLHKLCPN